MTRHLIRVASALLILLAQPSPVAAQSPFDAVLFVNDRAITRFEVEQRILLLELFNTPGDLEELALQRLIDERLQVAEARRQGIRPTREEIAEGMAEFAGRVELTTEEFLELIGEEGIEPESFSDFVAAGLAWREVLRERFADRVNPTEAEIDRVMSLTAQRRQVRVLLSEIVLPDVPEAREIAELVSQITSTEEFSEAARQISAAPSADDGGRIDWIPITNLPEPMREMIAEMPTGTVTQPIPLQGAIVLLQLRGRDLTPLPPPSAIEVDYAVATMGGAGTAEAEAAVARILASAETCADFAWATRHLPEPAVRRVQSRLSEVPADIARELARLDENEVSSALRSGGTITLVMLCSRQPGGEDMPSRGQVTAQFIDQRIDRLSEGLMADLRAFAVIRRP